MKRGGCYVACSKDGGRGVREVLCSNAKAKIPKRSGLQPKSLAILCAVLCQINNTVQTTYALSHEKSTNALIGFILVNQYQ